MKIALVTDSTGDFETGYLEANGVAWVPNYVIFGDKVYADRVDLQPKDFYKMLRKRKEHPSTSQPTPADLAPIYQRFADEGYDHIISTHISAGISGTVNSATLAAKESPIPVTVVDSMTTTVQLRFAMEAAIKARDEGKNADEIIAVIRDAVDNSKILVMLDTLDALVRGGRAGRVQGFAANVLNIKLIVMMEDGKVTPWKKAKGRKKAINEIADEVKAQAEKYGKLEVMLLEVDSGGEIEKMREAVESLDTTAEIVITGPTDIGPTVAVHTSTGCLGIAYRPLP